MDTGNAVAFPTTHATRTVAKWIPGRPTRGTSAAANGARW